MDDLDSKGMHTELNENCEKPVEFNSDVLSDKMKDEMHIDISDESGPAMDIEGDYYDPEQDNMKESLLDCVAESDGFFKSQQVGESDLTFSEKREIASDLLKKNKPLFLQRYWKFIRIDDVPYFDTHRTNYDVNFYVTEIIKSHNSRTRKVRIKNRRYEALQKMIGEGNYFSDAEMKRRNPFLFDQMIGQHLTENERIAAYKNEHPDEKFSAFLMNQMERYEENFLFEKQKVEDEAVVEEEDDDSTSEDESELEDDEPVKKIITDEEKKLLRSEFTNIMYESFLDGKDREFDYSSVDNNVEYDSVLQRDIDEQEKYFDESSDSNDE